jgi:hypothetical protein
MGIKDIGSTVSPSVGADHGREEKQPKTKANSQAETDRCNDDHMFAPCSASEYPA